MVISDLVTKSIRIYKIHNRIPNLPTFLWISSMSIIGGDVESVATSVPSSTAGSASAPATPRNRVKFLCSHGGKILPRPADGHLKYVGGETRVICVLRDITLPELMMKLTSMFDGEMILKYQLAPEDLDILVTVKSDEDVRHMIEECDRHESSGAPRLRAFLCPSKPIIMVNNSDHQSLEQRYINSINGILVNPPTYNSNFKPLSTNTSYTTCSVSSACSSPRSPPATTTTAASATSGSSLTRNRSSPNMCNLGDDQNQNVVANHHLRPPQHHHFHHQQPPQGHHSPKPPLDRHPNKTSGYYRKQADHNTRTNKGGHMYHSQKGSFNDDYNGNCRFERTNSPPIPGDLSQRSSR